MGDQQGGGAGGAKCSGDRLPRLDPERGIEGGEWLVEKDQGRFRRQRAGQRHALLLATGKLMRRPAGKAGRQPDQLQQLGDPTVLAALPPRQAEDDVVRHAEMREERAFLGDVADLSPLRRGVLPGAADDPSGDPDRAGIGVLEAAEEAKQGRLAAARAAEDRDQPAGWDVEGDAAEDPVRPKDLVSELMLRSAMPVAGQLAASSLTAPKRRARTQAESSDIAAISAA